jgi:allophanate hydrolase subunit 2
MCRPSRIEGRSLPDEARLQAHAGVARLRVLDAPQRDWFADDTFLRQDYEVLPASNRMGIRLKGTPLARRAGELVSEAVAPGAVQVTNDGLPVVLGVDGQTIGGYPKVAHVIRADLDLLAQLRPGERVHFDRVSPDEAEQAATKRAAFLKEWLMRLRIADRQPEFV